MNKLMIGLAISAVCLAYTAPALAQDRAEQDQMVQSALYEKPRANIKPRHTPRTRRNDSPNYEPIEQGYEIAPAMWLLSDEDTSIYMFGTYHVLPQGFEWRTAAFDAIVAEVDELVLETSDSDAGPAQTAMMSQIAELAENQESISSRLTPKSAKKWQTLADMMGVPQGYFDQMPILLAMFGIGSFSSQEQGSLRSHGVETILEAEFARRGKPVGSIEDAGEVMLSLMSVNDDLILAELERGLSEWNGTTLESFMNDSPITSRNNLLASERGRFKQEHSWARGELQSIPEDEFGEGAIGPEVYEVLLSRRNRAWTEWLDERLDQPGTILLAVGAAHFGGRDSVIELLLERGLVPARVQ